jgi:pantetheine-phosphate adenylyltransferase
MTSLNTLSIALWIVGLFLLSILLIACHLLYTILFPTILRYPWPDRRRQTKKIPQTVVFAGSFHPPHLGHVAMLQYLQQQYERVILVIGNNAKKSYSVSPQKRAAWLRRIAQPYSNVHVQVLSGYIWRTVQRQGAQKFVRGIRSWEQDGTEERTLQIQNTWGPILLGPLWYPLPTIFLQGIPKYNHISSTFIRNLIQKYKESTEKEYELQDHLRTLVPESILEYVIKSYQ